MKKKQNSKPPSGEYQRFEKLAKALMTNRICHRIASIAIFGPSIPSSKTSKHPRSFIRLVLWRDLLKRISAWNRDKHWKSYLPICVPVVCQLNRTE